MTSRKIVSEQVAGGKAMKDIMGYFKENYNGQYDGRMVSEMIKIKIRLIELRRLKFIFFSIISKCHNCLFAG